MGVADSAGDLYEDPRLDEADAEFRRDCNEKDWSDPIGLVEQPDQAS